MATRPGGNSCTTSGQRSFAPSGISRNVALFPRAKIIFHVRFQISERGTSWLSGYPPQLQNQLRLSRDDLAPNSMPWCVSTLPGRSTFRAWLDDASPANSRRAFTSATSSASTPQKTSPQSPPIIKIAHMCVFEFFASRAATSPRPVLCAVAKRTSRAQKVESALRSFALGFPETREDFPWGERVIKVGKKVFVFMGLGDGGLSLSVKLPESHNVALMLPFAEPTGYGLGRSGWVTARFDSQERPPEDMLCEWVEESYRAVAPKKLVASLADRGRPLPPKK